MARKVTYFSLILVVISSLFIPSARSATPITDFDGTYVGKFTVTVTVTIPTNPPRKISTTQTVPMQLSVIKGVITGWGKGFVINKAGKATMTIAIPPYGYLTFTSNFSRNSSTGLASFKGILTGSFPSARAVVTGNFTATGREKFNFNPRTLPNAKIGQKYPANVSFCDPPVPNGALCGLFARSNSPSGGKPPYTFKLKSGSILLPTGMILNSSTGTLSGTPIAGQKPGTRFLTVCAYDANDRFTGVCRNTTLTLAR